MRMSSGDDDFAKVAPLSLATESGSASRDWPNFQFGSPITSASSQIFGSLIITVSMMTLPFSSAIVSMLATNRLTVMNCSATLPGVLAKRTS